MGFVMSHTSFGRRPLTVMGRHRGHGTSFVRGQSLLMLALTVACAWEADAQVSRPELPSRIPLPSRDDAIGVAAREADGSIVLTLRAKGPDGLIGDAQFRYTPADPNYGMIARHVGPIPPGVTVPVKPFDTR
jgi:hypothetical protein